MSINLGVLDMKGFENHWTREASGHMLIPWLADNVLFPECCMMYDSCYSEFSTLHILYFSSLYRPHTIPYAM